MGITVGRKSPVELRDLYAGARVVVVPLYPSKSHNGISTCLEAMAMGKAVICTLTEGQVGALGDEINSIRVPPRDEVELRRAIERLWGDPELCARLGAAGRRLVEQRYDAHKIAQRLASVVKTAAEERASDAHPSSSMNAPETGAPR